MNGVLLTEDRGRVRLLTMNRPEKLNALNSELTDSLLTALEKAERDTAITVVVLTGAGRAFCAGADLGEFKDLSPDQAERVERRAELTMRLHLIFSQMKKPVIAAVRGAAMGGGAGLALACDLAIASENAQIGYPEIKHGILPALVLTNLVRQVGRKAAFEMMATGEPLGAQRAYDLGMINRVVADGKLMDEALGIAGTMASRQPEALFAMKRLFHTVSELSLEAGLEEGRKANIAMRSLYRERS